MICQKFVSILLLIGLSWVAGGCSWVNQLTGVPSIIKKASPQAQTTATVDFYVIDLRDFPEENNRLLKASKEFLEEVHREQFGRPVKIEIIDTPIPTVPPDLALKLLGIFPIQPDQAKVVIKSSRAFQASKVMKTLFQEIRIKARNNKEKYLVASISANPIDPEKLCTAFKRVLTSGTAFIIDTHDDEALRSKVNKLLRNCKR